jgi:hypothetical protein
MKNMWMVAAATTMAVGAFAQDAATETQSIGTMIDAHALVDVVNDEIMFDFTGDDPTEAGNGFVLGANKLATSYLNYSLMLSNGGLADGTISVKISGLNEGMRMSLTADGTPAASLPASQYGALGTVVPGFDVNQGAAPVKLTATDQVLIENIGTSYTGNGAGNGYVLNYSMSIEDYAQLDADNGAQDVGTITYTIAE